VCVCVCVCVRTSLKAPSHAADCPVVRVINSSSITPWLAPHWWVSSLAFFASRIRYWSDSVIEHMRLQTKLVSLLDKKMLETKLWYEEIFRSTSFTSLIKATSHWSGFNYVQKGSVKFCYGVPTLNYTMSRQETWRTRGGKVCWVSVLQAARSRVRFLMTSLDFFPAAQRPCCRLSV